MVSQYEQFSLQTIPYKQGLWDNGDSPRIRLSCCYQPSCASARLAWICAIVSRVIRRPASRSANPVEPK